MRSLLPVISCAALLACTASVGVPEALDGAWILQSAESPLDPRTLNLTQHGSTIHGSGAAMGVDAPMPLSVSGTVIGSRVLLSFRFTNGSELAGEYTAMFESEGRLVGNAVFHNGQTVTHSLTYRRE